MYVYLAGPMQKGHRMENLRRGIDAADRIASRGHIVFCPHLNDIWHLLYPHDIEFWMKMDIAWVKKCDVLVRIHGYSQGADREEQLARQWNKIVFGGEHIDGLAEFMNSSYWCNTENPEDYSKSVGV